jgi:hypothetical protein
MLEAGYAESDAVEKALLEAQEWEQSRAPSSAGGTTERR